jgi:hypothetical protein
MWKICMIIRLTTKQKKKQHWLQSIELQDPSCIDLLTVQDSQHKPDEHFTD